MSNSEKKYILLLDTSAGGETDSVMASLLDKEKILVTKNVEFSSNDSQALLEEALGLQAGEKLSKEDFAGIALVQGAQRFTVSRLTTLIANTIAWSMKLPIASFKVKPGVQEIWEKVLTKSENGDKQQIDAKYSKDPTINS